MAYEIPAGPTYSLDQSSDPAVGLRSLGPTTSPAMHDDQEEEQIYVLNEESLKKSTRNRRPSTRLKDYVYNMVWDTINSYPSSVRPISISLR